MNIIHHFHNKSYCNFRLITFALHINTIKSITQYPQRKFSFILKDFVHQSAIVLAFIFAVVHLVEHMALAVTVLNPRELYTLTCFE